jgi:hypothetical protein
VGCCENGNEPSVPIKGREFLDKLKEYQLLKKDFVAWSWLIWVMSMFSNINVSEKKKHVLSKCEMGLLCKMLPTRNQQLPVRN